MILQPSTDSRHIPVMLMESLENLNIKNNGIYVDGTLGLGGHSEEILKKIDSGFEQIIMKLELHQEQIL